MLRLTLKTGETLYIGDSVRLRIDHAAVKSFGITIDAPPEIRILRDSAINRTAPEGPGPGPEQP